MATRSKRLRVLGEICAAIPVSAVELEQVEAAARRSLERVEDIEMGGAAAILGRADLSCPALVLRRCTVYAARPLICRLFGVAEGLACPHGCTPEREVSRDEVQALLGRLARL